MTAPDPDIHLFMEAAGRFLKTRYRLAPHEEEEVRQEINMAIAKTLKNQVAVEQKEAYARAIARNVTVSYLRRKKHLVSLDDLREYDADPPEPDDAGGPLEQMIREENRRFLYQAILSLADDYRRTLLAVYCEGLTPAQVADAEGAKVKTVYTRLARAEEQLLRNLRRRFSTLYRSHQRRAEVERAVKEYEKKRRRWSAEDRQILDLHFLEGKGPRAIARQLLPVEGMTQESVNAIETLIAQANAAVFAGEG